MSRADTKWLDEAPDASAASWLDEAPDAPEHVGMGEVQAAPSAKAPRQPGPIESYGTEAWKKGATLKDLVGKYLRLPPGPERNPGESDQGYALRGAHEGIAELGSPEGVDRAVAMVGGTMPGAAPAPSKTLAGMAETAAVRSLNADRTATRKAFKNSDEARHALGRWLLDEKKVPLRSPQAVRERMAEIKAEEGPAIGKFTKDAAAQGADGDLAAAQADTMADPDVARLARNTEHRPLYERVQRFLDDQLAGKTNKVSPEVLHDLRMQIDSLAKWDQSTPAVLTDAWRTARGKVDEQIAAAMRQAGLGEQWEAANARYANASRADDLARIGAERRQGNRLGSPSEKASAIAGGVAAVAHNPIAAVAIPAATVALNRYAMPVAARSLDFASRHLVPSLPGAGTTATVAAEGAPPFWEWLRRRQLQFGPATGAADESQE